MKTFMLFLLILMSNYLSSQIITGLNLTQNSTNQIKTNIKVQLPNWGEYSNHIININENIVTVSVCYYMSGATAVVNLENDLFINLPTDNNYTLILNIYLLGPTTCNYDQLEDTATLNFSTPIQGTVSLSANETGTGKQDLKLFPIPAKDELNILTKDKVERINIHDALGRKVPATIQNNKINTINLQNGIYFIEIFSDKGMVRRKFTVKK